LTAYPVTQLALDLAGVAFLGRVSERKVRHLGWIAGGIGSAYGMDRGADSGVEFVERLVGMDVGDHA